MAPSLREYRLAKGDDDRCWPHLDAALKDGDPELLKAALGDVARSQCMTEIAEATGLSRTGLYKALWEGGNPEFATIVKVLHPLGLRIGVRSAAYPKHTSRTEGEILSPALS